jgi:hypothetical protein
MKENTMEIRTYSDTFILSQYEYIRNTLVVELYKLLGCFSTMKLKPNGVSCSSQKFRFANPSLHQTRCNEVCTRLPMHSYL